MQAIVSQHADLFHHDSAKQFEKLTTNRFITENILVFLLQYLSIMLGTFLSPVWFASGTACGFIFLRGYSVLIGVGLGSFVAYYSAQLGIYIAASCSAIILLQTIVLVFLCRYFVTATLVFYRVSTFIKFVFLLSVVTLITSLCQVYIYYFAATNINKLYFWLHWWLANINGIFVFSFALIALDTFFPQIQHLKQINKVGLICSFILLALLSIGLLLSKYPSEIILFSISLFFFLIITSFIYGWCGVVTLIFFIGLLLGLGACINAPIFKVQTAVINLFYLQKMLLVMALTACFISVSRCAVPLQAKI